MIKNKERKLTYLIGILSGRDKACKGKVNYKSREKAEEAAIVMSRIYNSELIAYHCFYCSGFHIGRTRHRNKE